MEQGWLTIGVKADTKTFDVQIQDVERRINEIEKELSDNKKIGFLSNSEVHQLNLELEKSKNKLVQLKKQSEDTGETIDNSFGKSVKKAGKLALAIFGIRSAYLFLRRASSDLSGYDEQYAANLEYIRWVLTMAIAPILRWIVNTVGVILQYVYAILNAWFGIGSKLDLSAEAFNKMKAGASGTSKAVKEIKKQLLGFDEINMLTDQSDTGTSAGAGGVGMPDFDLAKDVELPDWLKNNRDIILGKGALDALADTIQILSEKTILGKGSLKALSDAIEILSENGLLSKGALDALADIIDKLTRKGMPLLGGLKAISEIIEKFTNKGIKSLTDAERDLKDATQELTDVQDKYKNSVDELENAQHELTIAENKTNLSGQKLYDSVQQGTLDFENMTEQQKEVYNAYLNTKTAEDNLNKATQELTDAKKKEKLASLENQLTLANEKKEFGEYKDAVVDAFKKGEISSEEARELINKSMSAMSEDARKTFTEDLPDDIKTGLGTSQYEQKLNDLKSKFVGVFGVIGSEVGQNLGANIGEALKQALNYALSVLEWKINSVINLLNTFISGLNNNPLLSGAIGWIGRINTISLPRLATGGIVNMPNRGTLVGSAIAGESGREGVIPLTDSQAMAELGREIGRYITVNANIVNSMNGRVISRELKHIQNDQDFVYNT